VTTAPAFPAGRETQGVLDHVTLHRVTSMGELDECRRWLGSRREVLCVDTESAGLMAERDAHRMTQLGDMDHGWSFSPAWMGAAHEMITGYDGRLGFFNSGYDWRVLATRAGVTPRWEQTDDAQLAGHLVHSAKVNKLKPRAALDVDPRSMAGEQTLKEGMSRNKWTWATVPDSFDPYWMYGALDTVLTAHMLHRYMPEVLGSYRASYELEIATARICTAAEMAGLAIDEPYIREWITRIEGYTSNALAWLRDNAGITSVDSNDQIGRALQSAGVDVTEFTPSGMAKADKATLELYAALNPHAAPMLATLLNARKGLKISGSYLQKFLDMAVDGVVHCSIHTCQARTSRMSATNPPLHQLDRIVRAVRGSFVPRPGHVFVTIDADQIEARLCACFSHDQQLIADFAEADATGQSFFLIQAAGIYREQITKSDPRYTTTKNAFYGWQFGAGLETAAATAGVPIEQMRPAYEGIKQRYPGVQKMMNHIVRSARNGKGRPQIRTAMGRRLYGDRGKEYALQDYLIQGSAAEIEKQGGVNLEAAGLGPFIRLPTHDEWMLECPASEAQEVLRTAERVLTDRTSWEVPLTWSGTILEDRWRKT
jgi:DNA polymerase I